MGPQEETWAQQLWAGAVLPLPGKEMGEEVTCFMVLGASPVLLPLPCRVRISLA